MIEFEYYISYPGAQLYNKFVPFTSSTPVMVDHSLTVDDDVLMGCYRITNVEHLPGNLHEVQIYNRTTRKFERKTVHGPVTIIYVTRK